MGTAAADTTADAIAGTMTGITRGGAEGTAVATRVIGAIGSAAIATKLGFSPAWFWFTSSLHWRLRRAPRSAGRLWLIRIAPIQLREGKSLATLTQGGDAKDMLKASSALLKQPVARRCRNTAL